VVTFNQIQSELQQKHSALSIFIIKQSNNRCHTKNGMI